MHLLTRDTKSSLHAQYQGRTAHKYHLELHKRKPSKALRYGHTPCSGFASLPWACGKSSHFDQCMSASPLLNTISNYRSYATRPVCTVFIPNAFSACTHVRSIPHRPQNHSLSPAHDHRLVLDHRYLAPLPSQPILVEVIAEEAEEIALPDLIEREVDGASARLLRQLDTSKTPLLHPDPQRIAALKRGYADIFGKGLCRVLVWTPYYANYYC